MRSAALMLAVAGCAAPAPPQVPAAALLALPLAADCIATLPTFGRFRYPGDPRLFTLYLPPDGRIRLGRDAGWCAIRHVFYSGSEVDVPAMALASPPAHGEIRLGHVGQTLWIAYRPEPGYAGEDGFVVRQLSPQPWDVPVRVTVTR